MSGECLRCGHFGVCVWSVCADWCVSVFDVCTVYYASDECCVCVMYAEWSVSVQCVW